MKPAGNDTAVPVAITPDAAVVGADEVLATLAQAGAALVVVSRQCAAVTARIGSTNALLLAAGDHFELARRRVDDAAVVHCGGTPRRLVRDAAVVVLLVLTVTATVVLLPAFRRLGPVPLGEPATIPVLLYGGVALAVWAHWYTIFDLTVGWTRRQRARHLVTAADTAAGTTNPAIAPAAGGRSIGDAAVAGFAVIAAAGDIQTRLAGIAERYPTRRGVHPRVRARVNAYLDAAGTAVFTAANLLWHYLAEIGIPPPNTPTAGGRDQVHPSVAAGWFPPQVEVTIPRGTPVRAGVLVLNTGDPEYQLHCGPLTVRTDMFGATSSERRALAQTLHQAAVDYLHAVTTSPGPVPASEPARVARPADPKDTH